MKASATLIAAQVASELRAEGHDIIDLSVGEPDFDTPEFVKEFAREGLALGLIAAVGIALPLTAVGAVFEGRNKREPWTWFAINGGYNVVGIVVASVILAIWD